MQQATYSGISFPPRKNKSGFFSVSTDDSLVRESIFVILNTKKGEMVMNLDFGCSAHDLLFEPINPLTQNIIAQNIKQDIERWEPRVDVLSVTAYSNENTRIFDIVLRMKSSGQTFDLRTDFNSAG